MRRIKIYEETGVCPDRWSEVTLGQLLQIEKGNSDDEIFLLSVLTGLPYKTIVHSDLTEGEVYEAIRFIYEGAPQWTKLSVPSKILIGNKVCKVPRVDKVALGQHIMVAQLLEQPLTEVVITIMAVYFQPIVDGTKFDRDRVPEIEKLIANVPAVEGWPVAFFFLRSIPNLNRISTQGFIQLKKIP